MTNVLDKFVQDIKANVPGFIAVSVTEVKSGVSYIAYSADPNFDPNLASAYNLEVVKVDAEKNLLLIKGAIPGAKGSVVTVKAAIKGSN